MSYITLARKSLVEKATKAELGEVHDSKEVNETYKISVARVSSVTLNPR